MGNLKINGFEIQSTRVYNALKNADATSKETLSKLDLNKDNKISEDELCELLGEDSLDCEEKEEDTLESEIAEIEKKTREQLDKYDQINLELEEQLSTLYCRLGTAKDLETTDSLLSSIESLEGQIKENREIVYNILLQSEEQIEQVEKKYAQIEAANNNAALNNSYSGYNQGQNASYMANDASDSGLMQTSSTSSASSASSKNSDFAGSIVSIAESYVGKLKESDGSYLKVTGGRKESWCADFVTYVVQNACAQTGTSLRNFGSPSVANLQAWGRANKCYVDVTSTGNRAQAIVNNVTPGDIMIQKSNGASHTGIVTKVYSDGSFDTIEGNTSDQCLKRHYNANSSKLSGFINIA